MDCYLLTIMRLWQTPRLLGHVDTELPEFVFETSFKIVPSNPSSEVAPCFELEPVYEISWQHGWWYIDFDIVFINQRAKNLAENRLMWTILISQGCFVEHHIVYLRGQKYRVRYLPQRFFWSEVRVCRSLVQGLIWSAGLKAEAFRLSIKIWYVRNNYFRSCNPGIGVAFVAVAHWPAGRLPGVSSQRGAGQQRVITRYTSPQLISPKSSEYKMQLEDDQKKFGYLHQILMWILKKALGFTHVICKKFYTARFSG